MWRFPNAQDVLHRDARTSVRRISNLPSRPYGPAPSATLSWPVLQCSIQFNTRVTCFGCCSSLQRSSPPSLPVPVFSMFLCLFSNPPGLEGIASSASSRLTVSPWSICHTVRCSCRDRTHLLRCHVKSPIAGTIPCLSRLPSPPSRRAH